MWLIFLMVYVVSFLLLMWKKPKFFFNPVFWMVEAGVWVIGMYYTSGFVYNYPLRWNGLLYYLLVIILFCVGFFVGKKYKIRIRNNKNVSKNCAVVTGIQNKIAANRYYKGISEKVKKTVEIVMEQKFVSTVCQELRQAKDMFVVMNKKIYSLIVFLGAIIFLVDFMIRNIGNTQSLHTEAVLSKVGVLAKICLLLGIVVWLGELAYAVQNNKKPSIVGCLAAISYFIPALLTSGRQSFLIFIIATLAIFMYSLNQQKQYKYLKQLIFLGIAAVFVIVGFSVFVAMTRQVVYNKANLFERMFNCSIPEQTKKIFSLMGPIGMLLCEVISYYSHELPMFQVFLDNWNSAPMLGTSQFPLISTNISQNSMFSHTAMWDKLNIMSEEANVYAHVWRTISADCIIDFGIIGGLIFMLFLGWIAGCIYRKTLENNTMKNQILLAMVNSGVFFSMQFSPLAEGYWYFPMLWLVVALPIINSIVKGIIRK